MATESRPSAASERASFPIAELDIAAARAVIRSLRDDMVVRGEAPSLFGQEHGDGLESILLNIEQTFGGELLYPTVVSRTAHLLYFVIKDHPLTDGNPCPNCELRFSLNN